jgi:hypothetical protein
MKSGQLVAMTALRHLGDTEDPFGSNTDRGGWIDSCQADWHLHGVPWCGCAVDRWFREAGVDDGGVCHPATGIMCANARNRGWVWRKTGGSTVPAGAIWISCGQHVEVVVGDRGDGLLDCIGGNVNQACRSTVRRLADATMIIVPPAILEGTDEDVRVYGFDDLTLRPKRFGPWRTKTQRENVIKKLTPERRKQVHRVRIAGKSPFAFVIYPRATTRWRFGPWDSKDARDGLMREYRASHSGRKLRPWALDVNRMGGKGGVTTGESVV